jgi:hypothetical protein
MSTRPTRAGARRIFSRRALESPEIYEGPPAYFESASVAALDEPHHHATVRADAVHANQLTCWPRVGIAVVRIADTKRECGTEEAASMEVTATMDVTVTMDVAPTMQMTTESGTAAVDAARSSVHAAHSRASHVSAHFRATAADSWATAAAVSSLRICGG